MNKALTVHNVWGLQRVLNDELEEWGAFFELSRQIWGADPPLMARLRSVQVDELSRSLFWKFRLWRV